MMVVMLPMTRGAAPTSGKGTVVMVMMAVMVVVVVDVVMVVVVVDVVMVAVMVVVVVVVDVVMMVMVVELWLEKTHRFSIQFSEPTRGADFKFRASIYKVRNHLRFRTV